MSEVICPECEEKWDSNSLGWHYWDSDHGYPEPTQRQTEIIEGLLMGDARAMVGHKNTSGNAHIYLNITNTMFISWVRGEMSVLATEPYVAKEPNDDDGCGLKTEMWRLRLRANPNYNDYATWFDGEKMPEVGELTPLRAKCWFACDGTVKWGSSDTCGRIAIGVLDDERAEYYQRLLSDQGFDTRRCERDINFNRDESKRFIEWMGEAPCGFKHKWEINDRSEHYRLKDIEYWTDQDY